MSEKVTALTPSGAGAQIIRLEEAKSRLARVVKVDEAKKIRDQAEAIRHYAKEQRLGLEVQNSAAEVKIRAERRAGELLTTVERSPGKRTDLATSRHPDGKSETYTETIKGAGIPEPTARRWQLEASLPEPQFEVLVATAKATEQELTSTAVQRAAIENRSDPVADIKKKVKADPDVLFLALVGKLHAATAPLMEPPIKKYAREVTGAKKRTFVAMVEKARKALEELHAECC